ncbi:hypothetical protein BJ322DRAFT_1109538 [Thelephora terrestris]|uniref:Fungal-type protein kinase domain-containing protein n=1 Tax=Thelephora terrestris TaxID=56493 RepID=A0A9P6HEM7_9AGAM|nr:hypothetical protein BJ322DRAFT_1109538 [Thelephora terrestris]
MSSHDTPTTPPQDSKKVQAHLESQQATNPNRGSSATGQNLTRVQKEGVKSGISVDMKQKKQCELKDMVRFLLALCCQSDSSTTLDSADGTLYNDCLRSVESIAGSNELKEKLESYKPSSFTHERQMYKPFTEVMNYALEPLSRIEVDGLPKFKSHIAFVPCDKGVKSDCDISGSSFKPDVAVMSIQDAYKLYKLDGSDAPELSKLITEISVNAPSGSPSWKTILSAIEIKRGRGSSKHQDRATQDVDVQFDEELGDSQPVVASTSSVSYVSSKRSASTAEMDTSAMSSSSKRPRVKKSSPKVPTQTLTDQNGIYSAHKFSDSFWISHVINLLVQGDCLWVSWIDREGPIVSSGCRFSEDISLTLVLLLVLQRFGRRQWGYIPELTTEDHCVSLRSMEADEASGEGEVTINFHPEDKVHSTWALLGRATTVIGAKVEGGTTGVSRGQDAQKLKPSVVSSEQRNKLRGYYEARDEYRRAYAGTVKSHNLVLKVSWPETTRVTEWETLKLARTFGENDKFIKGHIPEVRGGQDFDRYSTHHIRRFLCFDEKPGTRTLRLIAMDRLWPIHNLDGEQFWKAFWECVLCHYRLWVNGIHHGDISLHNLMYGISKAGDPLGIIIDFDLATCVNHPTTNNDRTGTIPFMAIDLLDGGLDTRIPRLYRHDLESLSWVLVYVTVSTIQYKDNTIDAPAPQRAQKWFTGVDRLAREAHAMSKLLFHLYYGKEGAPVYGPYNPYSDFVQNITQYWSHFHMSLKKENPKVLSWGPKSEPVEAQVSRKAEVDDPAGSLKSFVNEVEKLLGEVDVDFARVKGDLLEAIETPPFEDSAV